MHGCFNVHKSISVIHHINKKKDKKYTITSKDEEKIFDKVKHPFMIQTLNKVGLQGTYLNKKKVIYEKLTANFIPNNEKLKAFPLKS